MNRIMDSLVAVVGVGVVICAIVFASYYGAKYFYPRYEQVRYDTFKNGQAYNEGMLQDLNDIRREYLHADKEHQDALKSIALHRFAAYDIDRLPPDLRQFYNDLQK